MELLRPFGPSGAFQMPPKLIAAANESEIGDSIT